MSQNIFDITRNQIRMIIAKTDHFYEIVNTEDFGASLAVHNPCHEGENQTAGSCVQ